MNKIKNRLLRQQEPASNTSEDASQIQQKYCIIFGAAMQAEHLFSRWLLFLYSFLHKIGR